MNGIKKLIVSGLGTGYLPVAPGTWGSGAVAIIFFVTAWVSAGRWYCTAGTMLAVFALTSVGCVALGRFAENTWGKKDPGVCTLDEWAGQAVTYLLLPLGAAGWGEALLVTAVGFVAFRILDIIKPPPARLAEKLPAGWGVLLDDLIAAVYANLASQLLLRGGLLDIV
jgi:phosphatidylglycerophosphatase A